MPRLQTLQAVRAIGVILVILSHAGIATSAFIGGMPAWASLFELGKYGVDAFFVVSGFIIYWTAAPRSHEPGWLGRYAVARATRIFLPYLPIGIAMAVVLTLIPALSREAYPWDWFASLTLLPGEPALQPAWSLQDEVGFYAIMGLLLATRKVVFGLSLWALIVLALQIHRAHGTPPVVTLMSLEFIAGVCVAAIMRRGWLPSVQRAFETCRFTLLVRLGDASYSLFLVHAPAQSLAVRGAAACGLGWAETMLLLVATSIAAGLIYYRFCEQPMMRWARRLRSQSVRRPECGRTSGAAGIVELAGDGIGTMPKPELQPGRF